MRVNTDWHAFLSGALTGCIITFIILYSAMQTNKPPQLATVSSPSGDTSFSVKLPDSVEGDASYSVKVDNAPAEPQIELCITPEYKCVYLLTGASAPCDPICESFQLSEVVEKLIEKHNLTFEYPKVYDTDSPQLVWGK